MTVSTIGVSAFLLTLAVSLPVQAVVWERVADEQEITVVTANEDGSRRETTIWLVIVSDEGYIRTARTRWGANMERDPDVVLRIAGTEYPLKAGRITDDELFAQVQKRFREKYGFSDRFTGLFRSLMGGARIYRMIPRSG